jgi:adenylylsulfate kinase
METKRRSFIKALSWRVFATVITGSVAYALTGKAGFALEIGLIDTAIKIFVYFAHERVWQRIPYGRVEAPDYQV